MTFNFSDSANIGKEYNGFILLSVDDLPDYKTKAVYLRHKTTGLEVYHVLAEDKENLFAYAFRTLAKDSKGIAHIMEHSVLCGSEKYPLKEPFATLNSTCINTYLNALTYPDKTVYPAASTIRKDYFTMMDVYGDAVFFPLLEHSTFIQEGHRLELDNKGKLSIQGVVYNEMKGNYSSFQPVACSKQINALFPESFPAYDSGGDPLDIPSVTYEEFLDFHKKYYAPDNCLLYLYGDIPTATQLDFINEKLIARLEKKYGCKGTVKNADSPLPLIKNEIKKLQKINLRSGSELQTVYDIGPETGASGNYVSVNYYTGKADIEKYFLNEVLCGNDSSPLSRALRDSGIGDDEDCYNFGQFEQEFFTIGMWNVKKGEEEKLFELINKTVREIYEKGVSQEDIDAAIMGIDFNLREKNRHWGPYSLVIMERVTKGWNYGKSCAYHLSPITSFEKVKQKVIRDKDFTRKLIKKYFIDSKIQVRFICEPSKSFFKERNRIEKEHIKDLEKNLNREELKKNLEELHAYQSKLETPEETACIPTTRISELDKNIECPECELKFVEGADNSKIPVFVSKQDTNGIFYMNVFYPFDRLEPKYYEYVPFLSNVLTNLGWAGKGWDLCTQEMACVMGDMMGRMQGGMVPDAPVCREFEKKYKEYNFTGRNWIGVSCKALTEKATESLEIMSEALTKMDFDDKKHFNLLLGQLKAEKKAELVSAGRNLAVKRARCLTNPYQTIMEIMGGLSQFETCMAYSKKESKKILETYRYIYEECRKSGGIIQITADEESLKKILPCIEAFAKKAELTKLLPKIPRKLEDLIPYVKQAESASGDFCSQVMKVASQTGYAAAVTKCSDYFTKESLAESVFSSWFSNHILWDKVRTMGGAYGADCRIDSSGKSFIMTSYRDPNPHKTTEIFKECLKEVTKNNFSDEEIEKTIVSYYGDFIYPMSPKDKGHQSFEDMLYATPSYLRQKRVEMLLELNAEDIDKAVRRLYKNTQKLYRTSVFCDKSVDCGGNILKITL